MSKPVAISIDRKYISILRISIGVIYFWFGALKFVHGFSPAEELAMNTIDKLTFHILPSSLNLFLLAFWETALGLVLISGFFLRQAILWLLIHMACTFTPLLFFPKQAFNFPPYGFSLVGQYIMKNIIVISSALVLYSSSIKKCQE